MRRVQLVTLVHQVSKVQWASLEWAFRANLVQLAMTEHRVFLVQRAILEHLGSLGSLGLMARQARWDPRVILEHVASPVLAVVRVERASQARMAHRVPTGTLVSVEHRAIEANQVQQVRMVHLASRASRACPAIPVAVVALDRQERMARTAKLDRLVLPARLASAKTARRRRKRSKPWR